MAYFLIETQGRVYKSAELTDQQANDVEVMFLHDFERFTYFRFRSEHDTIILLGNNAVQDMVLEFVYDHPENYK